MGEVHVFEVRSTWTGDSDGDGVMEGPDFTLEYGRPSCLGGPEGRTNPEELLLAAVVSCYSITLAGMAEGRKLPVSRIDVDAEADVIRDENRRLVFTAVRLHPRICTSATGEVEQNKILQSAHKAEEYCLISNTMRGNVEFSVEPELIVEEAVLTA